PLASVALHRMAQEKHLGAVGRPAEIALGRHLGRVKAAVRTSDGIEYVGAWPSPAGVTLSCQVSVNRRYASLTGRSGLDHRRSRPCDLLDLPIPGIDTC